MLKNSNQMHPHSFPQCARRWLTIGVLGLAMIGIHSGAAAEETPSVDGVAQYRKQLDATQRRAGAYDYALVEPAIGLGIMLQAQQQHDLAIDAFKRALHVNRINKGLHHLDHVPIVDLLLASYLSLGDWVNADRQQRFRYWINYRELASGSAVQDDELDRLVDAAIHYAAWQSKAYMLDTGSFPLQQLRDAQDALADAELRLGNANRGDDVQMLRVLNATAMTNFNIALHLSNTEVDPVTGSYAGDQDVSDYLLRQNIIIDSFRSGTEALQRVVDITAKDAPSNTYAMARMNYADWQLLFDRPQTAQTEYAASYDAFVAAGESPAAVNRRFAHPTRIDAFRLHSNSDTEPAQVEKRHAYVIANFEVTRTGKVRDLDIEESWPSDNRRIRRMTRERLGIARFRPALENGKPIPKQQVKMRYVFPAETI